MDNAIAPTPTKPTSSERQNAEDEKFHQQTQIANVHRDVTAVQAKKRRINEKIWSARQQMPEYKVVEELEADLETARKNLSMAEANNKAINDFKEERSKVSHELNELDNELSALLVHFITKYQQRSIDIHHQYRIIDVTASIGKALEQQTVLPL